MPRVTEVLDYLTEPELLRWMLRIGKKKREAISEAVLATGTEVDLLVQQDIKEGGYLLNCDGSGPAAMCMKAWELFKKEHNTLVAGIIKEDMQIELNKDEVIGHPDLPIIESGRVGIIDIKCASSIRPRNWTQVAKYLDMYTADPEVRRFIGILRLDKITGLYEYKEIIDEEYIQYELRIFDAYLTAYNHNVKNREQIRQQLEEDLLNVS